MQAHSLRNPPPKKKKKERMTCADGGQNRKTSANSPGLDEPFSVRWSLWDAEVLRWHTLLVSVVAIMACARSLEVLTEGQIMRVYSVYGHRRIQTQWRNSLQLSFLKADHLAFILCLTSSSSETNVCHLTCACVHRVLPHFYSLN